MAEDVEGNDSLGPDLKERHRSCSNGALGGPAAGLGERREFGVGRKKKGRHSANISDGSLELASNRSWEGHRSLSQASIRPCVTSSAF